MPGEFVAGSVLVELKGQYADLKKTVAAAKGDVTGFGQSVETTAKKVDQSGQQISKTFEATATRSAKSFASMVTRMLSLQIAMQSIISGRGGTTELKEAMESLSAGINTASAAFSLAKGRISLFGAGAIAVAVTGIELYTRHLETLIKLTEESTDLTAKSDKEWTAYSLAVKDANEAADVFGKTLGDRLTEGLHLSESAFASNQKRLREIPEQIAAINKELSALQGGNGLRGDLLAGFLGAVGIGAEKFLKAGDEQKIALLKQQIGTLMTLEGNLTKEQADFAKNAPFQKANAEVVKMNESLAKTQQALADIEEIGKISLDLGVATPAEVASNNLSAAKKALDQLLSDNQRIRAIALSGAIPSDQVDSFLAQKLHSGTDIGAARDRVLSEQAKLDAQHELHTLATGFSTAIADGLADAILSAKKPMEALAGIGQNLFKNMIDQLTRNLATSLQNVFESLGAKGPGIGAALTGIFGVAGFALSRLGNKSNSSFGNVQSAITSSEATRGIIAGPANIAIASVGENLQRAMAPVVSRLDIMITVLTSIEFNTRSGRPGGNAGGGSQFPGAASSFA